MGGARVFHPTQLRVSLLRRATPRCQKDQDTSGAV